MLPLPHSSIQMDTWSSNSTSPYVMMRCFLTKQNMNALCCGNMSVRLWLRISAYNTRTDFVKIPCWKLVTLFDYYECQLTMRFFKYGRKFTFPYATSTTEQMLVTWHDVCVCDFTVRYCSPHCTITEPSLRKPMYIPRSNVSYKQYAIILSLHYCVVLWWTHFPKNLWATSQF